MPLELSFRTKTVDSTPHSRSVSEYRFSALRDVERSVHILASRHKELTARILETGAPNKKMRNKLSGISETIADIQEKCLAIGKRNILSRSSLSDNRIGHGQDSNVYELAGTYFVYKESAREATPQHVEYLKKKYEILRAYIPEHIPTSFFVLGETLEHQFDDRHLRKVYKYAPKMKAITIQRRVTGKTLKAMTDQEKHDPVFLSKLEEAHKKYILLKLFVSNAIEEGEIMDVKLDLGGLSRKDAFGSDLIDIDKDLDSPNIMWDGNKVYFIDFDSGIWCRRSEDAYKRLMSSESFRKWSLIWRLMSGKKQ